MAAAGDVPTWKRFVVSGAAGMSGWLLVHPFDVAKVHMQLGGATGIGQALGVLGKAGPGALYAGLSAALARQASYTTLRLGIYDTISSRTQGGGVGARMATGATAGGIASLLSCPIEVSLVRMQADGSVPAANRRNYKHVGDALVRILREEGLAAYWAGSGPTVARAIVVSMTQLAAYDQAKQTLKESCSLSDGVPLHFAASLFAGFVYSAASLPLDTIKTRVQNESRTMGQQSSGAVAVTRQLVQREGILRLWKGFAPYFIRAGGHTIFMFLFLEQYKRIAY